MDPIQQNAWWREEIIKPIKNNPFGGYFFVFSIFGLPRFASRPSGVTSKNPKRALDFYSVPTMVERAENIFPGRVLKNKKPRVNSRFSIFGGACGNQTRDLSNANAALYQLS